MNETTGQNEGFNSPQASNPVSPYLFYQMRDKMSPRTHKKTPNQNGLNSPKHLPSLLQSPLFASTPSRFGDRDRRSTTNDEKVGMGKENRKRTKATNQKKGNSKTAKPSIADVLKEQKRRRLQSESEAEDERVAKKQKPNFLKNYNNRVETDDDWNAVWEESVSVTPMFFGGKYENPYQESIDKLEKWTNELLDEQKKIENARIQNALALNRLLKVRATRECGEND